MLRKILSSRLVCLAAVSVLLSIVDQVAGFTGGGVPCKQSWKLCKEFRSAIIPVLCARTESTGSRDREAKPSSLFRKRLGNKRNSSSTLSIDSPQEREAVVEHENRHIDTITESTTSMESGSSSQFSPVAMPTLPESLALSQSTEDSVSDSSDLDSRSSSSSREDFSSPTEVGAEDILRSVVTQKGFFVMQLRWFSQRVEVIVSSTDNPDVEPEYPSVEVLKEVHREIYETLEQRGLERVVEGYEIVIASPGIGENLRFDRDFVTFKGFTVTVATREPFKKKLSFEGTLLERTPEVVAVSLKGRVVKIPRELVASVRLPSPKFEPGDDEIRQKLRD